jgi:hypothetical protein
MLWRLRVGKFNSIQSRFASAALPKPHCQNHWLLVRMRSIASLGLLATAATACVRLAHIGLQTPMSRTLSTVTPGTVIGVHATESEVVGGSFTLRVSKSSGVVLEEVSFACASAPMEVPVLAAAGTTTRQGEALEVTVIGPGGKVLESRRALGESDPWTTSDWVGGFGEMRTEVQVSGDEDASAYSLHFAAVGCGELRINGVVATNAMSPGWATIPEVATLYESLDVTDLIQPGENVLGVRIGKCKWGYRGEYCAGTPAECNAARFELHSSSGLVYASSSATITGHQSPIVFDDLYLGETYNATLEEAGWDMPGFAPPTPWSQALTMHPGVGSMRQAIGPPMVLGEAMMPIAVTASALTEAWVVDIGVNIAGICRLAISAATLKAAGFTAGSVVSMEHGELLNPDGSVRNQFDHNCAPNSLNCATQRDQYTISSQDLVSGVDYLPTFTYHGFRRVSLRGWSHSAAEHPSTSTVTCYHLGNHVNQTSSFDAGMKQPNRQPGTGAGSQANLAKERLAAVDIADPASVLKAVDAATHLTQVNNLHGGHPEDCPTREKRGWMGDAAVSSPEAVRSFDMSSLYAGWMQAHRDQQTFGCLDPAPQSSAEAAWQHAATWQQVALADNALPNNYQCCGKASRFGCNKPGPDPSNAQGTIPDVIPFAWAPIGGWPGDPSWMLASVAIPYEVYNAYGSVAALNKSYDLVYDYLQAVTTPDNFDSRGVIAYSFYGDWLAVDKVSDSTLVGTASLMQALTEGISLAAALGRPVPQWVTSGSAIITAFSKTFLNAGGSFGDGTGIQTANALAYVNQAPGAGPFQNDSGKTAQALLGDISNRSTTLSVGVVGSRWLLDALEMMGRGDVATALATQTAEPSWGNFVSNASYPGTLWENWVGGSASYDHIMFGGGIGKWIHQHAAGIRVSHTVSPQRVMQEIATIASTAHEDGRAAGDLQSDAEAAMARLVAEAQEMVEGVLVLQPHGAALRRLGRVAVSRQTPLGAVRAEWTLLEGASSSSATVSAKLAVPASVCVSHRLPAKLSVPALSLRHALGAAAQISVAVSRVGADGEHHTVAVDSEAVVLPCGTSEWSIRLDRL